MKPKDRDALNSIAEAYAKIDVPDSAMVPLHNLLSLERTESNDFVVGAKVHEILGSRDSALYYVQVAL